MDAEQIIKKRSENIVETAAAIASMPRVTIGKILINIMLCLATGDGKMDMRDFIRAVAKEVED